MYFFSTKLTEMYSRRLWN